MKNAVSALVKRERSLSAFIPFTACYNATTLITRQSDFVRTWQITGLAFETADPLDVERDKEGLNTFLRSIGSEHVSIFQHTTQRRCAPPKLRPSFNIDYAQHVSKTYQKGLENSVLFNTNLYITIVYRADATKAKGIFNKAGRTVEQLKHQRKKNLQALDRIGQRVEASLSAYGPRVLGEYENEGGFICSEPLEFENFLLSGFWQPILKPARMPLYNYLGSALVFAGTDVVETRRPSESRFSQIIEIKDFANTTEAGILNCLTYLDIEFVSCASFCTMQRHDANNKLGTQIHHLKITDQDEEADEVRGIKVGLEKNLHSLGEYNYTLRISADSVQAVRDDVAIAISSLENLGYIAVTSGLATDSAFFSQVPGNFADRTRLAHLTSQNYAGFVSMHNHHAGRASNMPWGNAVLPLKTDSNRIVYFNLHNVGNTQKDMRGKLVPACLTIIGKTGEGKTTVLNMITCALQQYGSEDKPLLDITLDIKQGSRKTIEALGGVYSQLKNAQDTGYNPFKMDPTPDVLNFLDELVIYLCSQNNNVVTTPDEKDIRLAVRAVMGMDKELRGFTALRQYIPSDGSGEGIADRLAPWCSDDGTGRTGPLAWVLDSESDDLDFSSNTVFGIDNTDLLENPTVRTPLLMYILFRIKQELGMRRVCIKLDEAFQQLDDPMIGPFVDRTIATIRSKDGVLVLATQMPSSIIKCAAGDAILQQTATFMFLRNPAARWDDYEKFKMTGPEFDVMLEMEPHHFLIKQDNNSSTATIDLSHFNAEDRSILAGENL